MIETRNLRSIGSRACRVVMLAALLLATGVGTQATAADTATVVELVEQESGVEPYRTRMITTASHLRIDDGVDTASFLLFDRAERTIYSVTAIDSRVLVIHPRASTVAAPYVLEHRAERDRAVLPQIDGREVVHYSLFTNGKRCYELYAADGLLPDVVQAVREYRAVLASRQAESLAVMPKELRTPCELANNIFSPTRHLEHGFPVRLQDMNGKLSELVDYRTRERIDPALFRLPEGYQRTTLEELRGG